jgi:diketogulonate reductase-like aldo/keto reductase
MSSVQFADHASALLRSNATVASTMAAASAAAAASMFTVGFGTAALGSRGFDAVVWALQEGFRAFDTAEEDEHWYDSETVGKAASHYFQDLMVTRQKNSNNKDADATGGADCDGEALHPNCPHARISTMTDLCRAERLQMSTKIPPWSLTSHDDIRDHARHSRKQLVGFCDASNHGDSAAAKSAYPLDIYYIHAPSCWRGWHPRCDNPPPILSLREAWLAMEAVVGEDMTASRIGLSNVRVDELLDVIEFVRERQQQQLLAEDGGENNNNESNVISSRSPPPRIPDAVQSYADPIEPADELRMVCAEHGIRFVSYSTLGTQHKYRRSRSGSGELENPVLTSPVVVRIANKHGRSVAEVVLSWAIQKNMAVIPRSTNRRHIQELARLFDDPRFLDADDVRGIDAMKHSI